MHVPCRKIGSEKCMHAACRRELENLYACGMQKRTYGRVTDEKIMLGRTGSPTRLGHLQLPTFISFISVCYSSLCLILCTFYIEFLHGLILNRELPVFPLFRFPVPVLFI